jgi:hypothetical protein
LHRKTAGLLTAKNPHGHLRGQKFELAMNFRPPSAQDQAAVDHIPRSLEGDLLRCLSQELAQTRPPAMSALAPLLGD